MKIKPEFSLEYEPDTIFIVRTAPNGEKQNICPISETAAMAWEGFALGLSQERLASDIAEAFEGADEAVVAADLEALAAQLVALGYAEA